MRMRICLIVAALFLGVIVSHSQEWAWQHPWPTNTLVYNIVDMHEHGVIFTGWDGVVLQTRDSGDSWSHHTLGVNQTWSHCSAVGSDQFWAMTSYGEFAQTVDGGESWSVRELSLDSIVYDAVFIGPDSGWALGHHVLYRSCDAGETWEEIFQYEGYWMTDIVALDNALLICAAPERGIIDFLYSEDSGDTWNTRSSISCPNIADIHVDGNLLVWVLVYRADGIYLLRSMDGGISWEELPGIAAYGLDFGSRFNMLDSQRGCFTISQSDSLAYTEDGGATWNFVDTGIDSSVSNVYFTSEQEGWLLTNNRVYTGYRWSEFYHTADGGQTWEHIDQQALHTLRDIAFIDEHRGWAVGDNSTALWTEDSGKHWEELESPIGVSANIVEIAPDGTVWMGGDIGAFYYFDSGSEHLQISVLPDPDFRPTDILFQTDQDIFAVSAKHLFRTADRGESWVALPVELDTNHYLESVEFVDSHVGWLQGYKYFLLSDPYDLSLYWEESLLLKTTDGGIAWTEQNLGDEDFRINTVEFINYSEGWAAGGNGLGPMILKTCDGGETWTEQYGIHELPAWGGAVIDMEFVNSKEGWAVGSDGLILHTVNGGENWERQYAGTRDHFYALEISHGQAWICGNHGVVLHLDKISDALPPMELLPISYHLRVFPNPFNSTTNLLLNLSREGRTTVDVYNIRGQLVERLFEGVMYEGENRISFDAIALPSGVYFANVTGDLSSTTQKLVLIR